MGRNKWMATKEESEEINAYLRQVDQIGLWFFFIVFGTSALLVYLFGLAN